LLEVLHPKVPFIPLHLMNLTVRVERNYERHYAIFSKYFMCEGIKNLDTEVLKQIKLVPMHETSIFFLEKVVVMQI
jgi:hypothetical protein